MSNAQWTQLFSGAIRPQKSINYQFPRIHFLTEKYEGILPDNKLTGFSTRHLHDTRNRVFPQNPAFSSRYSQPVRRGTAGRARISHPKPPRRALWELAEPPRRTLRELPKQTRHAPGRLDTRNRVFLQKHAFSSPYSPPVRRGTAGRARILLPKPPRRALWELTEPPRRTLRELPKQPRRAPGRLDTRNRVYPQKLGFSSPYSPPIRRGSASRARISLPKRPRRALRELPKQPRSNNHKGKLY